MSFSVLPIAAPVTPNGAAAPGAAAAGFEALLAALLGAPAGAGAAPAVGAQPAATQDDLPQEETSEDEPASDDAPAPDGLAAAFVPHALGVQPTLAAAATTAEGAPTASAPAANTPATTTLAAPTSLEQPSMTADPAAPAPALQAELAEPALQETQSAAANLPTPEGEPAPGTPASSAAAAAAQARAGEAVLKPSNTETARAVSLDGPAPMTEGDVAPAAPTQAAEVPPPAPPAAPGSAPATSAQTTMIAAAAQAGARAIRATSAEPAQGPAPEPDAEAAASGRTAALGGPPRANPFSIVQQQPTPLTQLLSAQAQPTTGAASAVGEASSAATEPPAEALPTDVVELEVPETGGPGVNGLARAEQAIAQANERAAATPATVADLAAQVARKLQARTSRFDIQLTPEGLGRVDVRVDIDAQGKLTAAMAFDNPQAANELRARAGELQRALEQAGFDLSGGLSFQSPDDQRGFAQERPEREPQSGRAFASALGLAESADAGAVAQVYQRRNSPNGVDVRI